MLDLNSQQALLKRKIANIFITALTFLLGTWRMQSLSAVYPLVEINAEDLR
jgi:hypothetical protein